MNEKNISAAKIFKKLNVLLAIRKHFALNLTERHAYALCYPLRELVVATEAEKLETVHESTIPSCVRYILSPCVF